MTKHDTEHEPPTPPGPTGHDTDAAELVRLHAAAVEADRVTAQDTTATTIEASLAAHRVHQEACEVFRRRHYPRAHRVVAVFGEVFTVSRTARSVRLVWSNR